MIITLKNATQAVHRVRDTSTSNNAHFFVPCILFIFALWLGTHPYQGLIHDSRLYAVQALNALFPERYARDLFLEFGSQDQFSAFSSIYKHVLRAFSLTQGTLFSTIIGEALWMVGLIFLVCSMVRDGNLRFLSIAMAIALPGEVVNSFRYGE